MLLPRKEGESGVATATKQSHSLKLRFRSLCLARRQKTTTLNAKKTIILRLAALRRGAGSSLGSGRRRKRRLNVPTREGRKKALLLFFSGRKKNVFCVRCQVDIHANVWREIWMGETFCKALLFLSCPLLCTDISSQTRSNLILHQGTLNLLKVSHTV